MKRTMIKYLILVFVLIVIFVFGRLVYIKKSFESIEVPILEKHALKKMGKPDEIYENADSVEWFYYQFPLPEAYVLIIKDAIVIKKYHSISP